MRENVKGSNRAVRRAARLVVWVRTAARGGRASALPIALLGALLLGGQAARAQSSGTAQQDEIESPEVVRLRFQGVTVVDASDLEKSIATTASHCKSFLLAPICALTKSPVFFVRDYLDRTELRRDVLRIKVYYFRRGYRETDVDTVIRRIGPKQVAVRFNVTEGAPTRVTSVDVVGADSIVSPKVKSRRMLLKPGQPLNLYDLDSSVVRLYEALWNAGYADAKVDTALTVDPAARTAALRVTLTPSWLTRVGTITVSGNRKVDTQTILNSLKIEPGDVFKRDAVVESQRALYESSLFRRAVIPAATGDSIKAVQVQVTEAPLHDLQTSVGANTFEFVQTQVRYTDYNFHGGARRLDLRGAVGNLFASGLQNTFLFKSFSSALDNALEGTRREFQKPTYQLSADLTQPFFGNPENTIAGGVFANRRAAPGVYIDKSYGAQATFTRELATRFPLSLGYRFEETRIDAGQVYFCINYGACDLPTAQLLSRPQRLSPVSLLGILDRTNDPFNPSSGYRANAGVEHASGLTASDYRYNRETAEGAIFRPFGKRVLAAHLRLGYVTALGASSAVDLGAESGRSGIDVLHPRKRFYAGGSQSVRGFGENQLGPRVLTIDPNKLRGRKDSSGVITFERCPPSTPIQMCGLNGDSALGLTDDDFTPRPTGGTALIEGSVEFRFPLLRFAGQQLGGAAFVDAGSLGSGGLGSATSGNSAITPGVGARYTSPIGAIRVDVGYQPTLSEDLCVVTQEQTEIAPDARHPQGDVVSSNRLVYVGSADGNSCSPTAKRTYAPLIGKGFPSHLVLHLSIGQAF